MSAPDRLHERVEHATELAADAITPVPDDLDFLDPQQLRRSLEDVLAEVAGRVRVAGTLDRRLIFIERLDGRWVAADLSGMPHGSRAWPQWADGHVRLDDRGSWLSLATQAAWSATPRTHRAPALPSAARHGQPSPTG